MTWYHVTPLANVESIERDGLHPVVHLSLDPEIALVGDFTYGHVQTCECATWHLAVYEVDVIGLEQEEGWDPDCPHIAVLEQVSPDRIKRASDPPMVTRTCDT